jgi:hypothetical protein
MADVKLGEPFGLESGALAAIDWDLALKRVLEDTKTDFIYAPHIRLIYARAGKQLAAELSADLKSGKFNYGIPIGIEVPKSFRIPVTPTKRLGPSYTRPGSILLPRDRLFYQALADQAAPIIEKTLDPERSFSHQLAEPDSASMFLPTRKCWNDLQKSLSNRSSAADCHYILKIDIANFFGSINHHNLINVLSDAGFPKNYLSRLEAILTGYTGERSSRGILQGIYPSDLFGNFYMAPIDRVLKDLNIPSSRYVDDMYIFLPSVDAADRLLRDLIPALRSYDLSLNESKCSIIPKGSLIAIEPDLDALFAAAVAEISAQIDDEDFDADYGFQSDWDDDDDDEGGGGEEDDEHELHLAATIALFDSIDLYNGQEENIERFCLPLFSKAGSSYAIGHVIDSFRKRASMAQIYCAYLANFIEDEDVSKFLIDIASDKSLHDWQLMWVIAALMQADEFDDAKVKVIFDVLRDGGRHDALRAVAAYFVGRYGDHTRRKALVSSYATFSNYVQAAIYASSRHWPGVERGNAKATWAGNGPLHSLLTIAMAKL